MTKVNDYQVKVKPERMVKALNLYQNNSTKVTKGMEMEHFLLKRDGSLPNASLHDKFYVSAKRALGDDVSAEPGAHMIEIKTHPHDNHADLISNLKKNLRTLKNVANIHSLKILNTSDIPNIPIQQIRENLASKKDPASGQVRRVEVLEDLINGGLKQFQDYVLRTTSIQLTHSIKDIDKMHRWAKIHCALMPIYYTVFENRTRTGKTHDALNIRRSLGEQGLIASYIFQAEDGEDFAEKYVEYVANTDMYTVFDENGDNQTVIPPVKFINLPKEKQTLGNFMKAASYNWGVCKIKPSIDNEALEKRNIALSNLLLEVRDFDTSEKGANIISEWLCTLTENEENLIEIEARLEDAGIPICTDPTKALKLIRESLYEVETKENYLDTSYGENSTLRDAIKEVMIPMTRSSKHAKTWLNISNSTKPPFKEEEIVADNIVQPSRIRQLAVI